MTAPDKPNISLEEELERLGVRSDTIMLPSGTKLTFTQVPEDQWEAYQEVMACQRRASVQRSGQLLHTVQFPSGRTSDQPEESPHPPAADAGSNQEAS